MFLVEWNFSLDFCFRYVPSFIPPPLASKGKESEKKVSRRDISYLDEIIELVLCSLINICSDHSFFLRRKTIGQRRKREQSPGT